MTTDPIVSLRDVGKRYVKYEDVPTLVSGVFRRRGGNRRSQLWAVRHVTLEVGRGEGVGVIGRNGAGKSTMLAMLAGVTAPTEGVVAVRGRVAPLLRLGVGFHDELTGRENVYINGTILGLSERRIDAAFDEIVAFAELEDFIDTPVKFYSSGMQARLGFSVAVASRPDVLIVDEVLAVGDQAFQLRSFERMLELQREGSTILVVSHNLDSIRRVCSRVLVLDKGLPYYEGPADEAISRYHDLLRLRWDELAQVPADGTVEIEADAPMQIVGHEILDAGGSTSTNFESGQPMTVRLFVTFRRSITDPIWGLWVTNQSNQLIYAGGCVGLESGSFDAGSQACFDITISLHLIGGTYTVGNWVGLNKDQLEVVRAPARPFYVSSRARQGIANLHAQYAVTPVEQPQLAGAASAESLQPGVPPPTSLPSEPV